MIVSIFIRDIITNKLIMYIPNVPNNSLTKEINEIIQLTKQLQETRKFVFNEPCSDKEISDWEKKHNIMIPNTFADWLRFSNGSILRGNVAELYGLNRIEFNVSGFDEDCVIIGSLIGDGFVICFSKDNGKIFTDDHGEITEYDSLNEILEEVIYEINAMW